MPGPDQTRLSGECPVRVESIISGSEASAGNSIR